MTFKKKELFNNKGNVGCEESLREDPTIFLTENGTQLLDIRKLSPSRWGRAAFAGSPSWVMHQYMFCVVMLSNSRQHHQLLTAHSIFYNIIHDGIPSWDHRLQIIHHVEHHHLGLSCLWCRLLEGAAHIYIHKSLTAH